MSKMTARLQQIAIGILAVLSLSFSSVAACTCSHHQVPSDSATSCHEGAHKDVDDRTASSAFGGTCACIQAPTDLQVKSESFKLKKQLAWFSATTVLPRAELRLARVVSVPDPEVQSYDRLLHETTFSRGPPSR